MILELILITVVLGLLLCKWNGQNGTPLPPGPPGLPLVGHLLYIVKDPHLKFSNWAKQYGKWFTVRLGLENALVLSDPKVLRDIFSHPASTWKFQTDTLLLMSRGPYGVVNSEGKVWEELRRFCVRNLRTFGFGNSSCEQIILREALELVNWIKEHREKSGDGSVVLYDVLKISANNTLWTMVSGERLDLGDSQGKMNILMGRYEAALQKTVKSGLMFFPSLKFIMPSASGFNDFDEVTKEIHTFIRKIFDEHRNTFEPGSRRDLTDCYIEHLKSIKDPSSGFYGELGETNTVSTIMELFVAGAETSAATINWMTIFLATHDEVQRKLRDEIEKVVGLSKDPTLEDRNRMPYMEAVILEILRYSSIGPLGVMHKLHEDIHYEGYRIPKGTILIPNIYHIQHNKEIWGDDVESFRPERFLDGNDKLKEALVVFQPGRRSCPGEPLLKDVLFILMTKLVQTFDIQKDPGTPLKNYFEVDVGLVMAAKPQKIIFKDT